MKSSASRRVPARSVVAVILGVSAFLVNSCAMGAAPVVSNVRASQRAGTKLVDVYYDVADADGDLLAVSVSVSSDGGSTYNVPASSFTGPGYGAGVSPGTNRHIVWNAGADWPGQYSTLMRVRVTASDGGAPPLDAMVLIPAGTFAMGDAFSEGRGDELPLHTVYVSAFYIDSIEVTKALWDEVRSWAVTQGYSFDNTGSGKAANHPVHTVNWYDVVKWCNARSEKNGLTPCYYTTSQRTVVYRTGKINLSNELVRWDANGYRLPTEAEWEKAARGGAAGRRFPWSHTDTIQHGQANYKSSDSYSYDISPSRGYHPDYEPVGYPYTSPVGSFAANGYGLYDMAGNVWEWCWDWYDGGWYGNPAADDPDTRGPAGPLSIRVLRGGSSGSNANNLRCAARYLFKPSHSDVIVGFRCARGQ